MALSYKILGNEDYMLWHSKSNKSPLNGSNCFFFKWLHSYLALYFYRTPFVQSSREAWKFEWSPAPKLLKNKNKKKQKTQVLVDLINNISLTVLCSPNSSKSPNSLFFFFFFPFFVGWMKIVSLVSRARYCVRSYCFQTGLEQSMKSPNLVRFINCMYL